MFLKCDIFCYLGLLIGTLTMEYGGTIRIECEKTGYHTEIEFKLKVKRSELYILISGTITFSHSIGKKMKHRYQSLTRIGRQFQSLERQVYAD